MKKGILLLILLIISSAVVSILFQSLKGRIKSDFTKALPEVALPPKSTPGKIVPIETTEKSIFIPYWTVGKNKLDTSEYKEVLYFGVSPTTDGLDESDEGYIKLSAFNRVVGSVNKKLVLRMTQKEVSQSILKFTDSQEKIIDQTLQVARKYGFSGVVLDLELSGLPFDSLVNQVTVFAAEFAKSAKQNDLDFAMTIYGDTFYRVRPFDIKALAKTVPSFYVMAYDFHKAGGNPGPNFPYSGKTTYGYDYQTMIDNFLEYIPAEKLTIIYGMYGYDWEVGENGKAVSDGLAKSLLQIRSSVIKRCEMLRCSISRDAVASELSVSYRDAENTRHIVWFEDEESAKKKEEFAKTMGISKFSYWSYSYF